MYKVCQGKELRTSGKDLRKERGRGCVWNRQEVPGKRSKRKGISEDFKNVWLRRAGLRITTSIKMES